MAKRKISTFSLDEEIKSKLLQANLKSVEDVLSHSLLQLMAMLYLSAFEVQDLVSLLSSACLPQCMKGIDLLNVECENSFSFGDSDLDRILHGGIKRGSLTEFTGPSGVGKTQMCFHFALKCLEKKIKQNSVCCIDTEGSFRSERLLEVIECNYGEEMISNCHIYQPKTVKSLTEILDTLEFFCIDNDVGLIIVDSIASLARKEFSQNAGLQRAAALSSWAAQLKSIADQLQIAVIVTNQVTTKMVRDDSSDEDLKENEERAAGAETKSHFIGPALGNTWTHFVNTRFVLQYYDSDVRQFIIAKSPVAPVASKNYIINSRGIKFTGSLSCTFAGIDPNKHKIEVQPAL